MTPVATAERTATARAEPAREHAKLFEPGGPTLEDRVLGSWDGLVANGSVECLVCGGSMSAAGGCPDCGSELS
jgi:hypothetical protein